MRIDELVAHLNEIINVHGVNIEVVFSPFRPFDMPEGRIVRYLELDESTRANARIRKFAVLAPPAKGESPGPPERETIELCAAK